MHQDLQTGATTPPLSDARAWREYVLPALTTASPEDVYALVLDPADLKRRTIGLIQGIWDAGYAADYAKHHEILEKAGELAAKTTSQGFGLAFPELTGNRLPAPLVSRLNDIETVTFCPSYYLNNFVSYILYPPNLIVFFAAGARMPDLAEVATEMKNFFGNWTSAGLLLGFMAAVPGFGLCLLGHGGLVLARAMRARGRGERP